MELKEIVEQIEASEKRIKDFIQAEIDILRAGAGIVPESFWIDLNKYKTIDQIPKRYVSRVEIRLNIRESANWI